MTQARNYKQTPFASIGTSPTEIASASINRSGLIVFNVGTTEVLIGIDEATIPIAAGQHLAFVDDIAPINPIVAKVASGTGSIITWES